MSADHTPTVQRAMRLHRAGRVDAARVLLIRTLEADPDNVDGWALMARMEYDLQDPSRTIQCLEQVVRLQPDNIRAQEHLHYLTGRLYTPAPPPEVEIPEDKPVRRRDPLVEFLTLFALIASTALLLILLAPIFPPLARLLSSVRGGPRVAAAAELPAYEGVNTSPLNVQPFSVSVSRQIARMMAGAGAQQFAAPPPIAEAPAMIDYSTLQTDLNNLVRQNAVPNGYDLGIAFVDVSTGQVIHVNGDMRMHSMSTFKGPLAAYYWWLLERGLLIEQPGDREHITQMLEVSANSDTSCLFQRVGGIAPFNDWLADQGFTREKNFVLKWQDWSCVDGGQQAYTPPIDWRYSRGDDTLGLPGSAALLGCPIPQLPCDKAFAPAELAHWYAKLYRGEVISPGYRDMLLPLMDEGPTESIFMYGLPADAGVRVYIKGGIYEATDEYRVNFVNEAGIIETPRGAFSLVVFMQQNPEWPGTWPITEAARLSYDAFMQAHAP